ncbi:MAG: hypothetical protein ACXU95_12225, partial [Isosphaeraceae bacterium]
VGYHCRDYFLKQWDKFNHVPWGTLGHSTHVRGIGTYEDVIASKTEVILLENEEVRILDLQTLIAGKEATFDDHDRAHLPSLYLLADEVGVPHRSLDEVEREHRDSPSQDVNEPEITYDD